MEEKIALSEQFEERLIQFAARIIRLAGRLPRSFQVGMLQTKSLDQARLGPQTMQKHAGPRVERTLFTK